MVFLSVISLLFFHFQVFAQTNSSAIETAVVKHEYTLPYPGILPDHPLFMFKNLRDSILELLITDPIRKIEFYILQSDKDVSASQFLFLKGKYSYINETVPHAVEFKEKAFSIVKSIKEQEKEVPEFLMERLTNSIQKQKDIHRELLTESDQSIKKILSASDEKITELQSKIDSLKK